MAFFITHVIAIIFELLSISFGRPLGFGFGFTVAVVLNDIFVHDEIRENERKKYIEYIKLIDKKEGEDDEQRAD